MTNPLLIARETSRDLYAREVYYMATRMEQVRTEFIAIGASWDLIDDIAKQITALRVLSTNMMIADVTLGIEEVNF